MLQKIADLFGDHAVEAILGLVDLREQKGQHFLRELHLAHELADVLRAFADLLVAGFDQALDQLGQEPLEATPLLLLGAVVAVGRGISLWLTAPG